MSLWELVAYIFLYNVMIFGNGPVMIPLLQKLLVEERHVLTIDQLLYAFTIARVTPGQANVYVAAIGFMLFGLPGAVLVTLAILLPGYLMIPLLKGFERVRTARLVRGFSRGLIVASVGLIFAATFQIAGQTLTNPVAWIVFPLTFLLNYALKWNEIISLGLASGVGLLLNLWF